MNETRLYRLFDLQQFEDNPRLKRVIDAAHRRCEDRELSDEELDMVAAAGLPDPVKKTELPK